MTHAPFLLIVLVVLLSGCDASGPESFESEIVVESYQVAGEPLAPVRLTRTLPLDAAYDYADQAVQNAQVTVDRLRDGVVTASTPYAADPDSLGFYRPAPSTGAIPRVEPLHTYRLRVALPDGGTVRATTVVPDTFSVVRVNRDTSTYQIGAQIALTVTPSRTPERPRSYYVFTTIALDPVEENLVPLVREFLQDSDDFTLEDARVTSSPPLSEGSYETNPDGTLTIDLPWVAVAFFGPNRARASALDNNLYDYLRSQGAQQGGGAFTPGSIPPVLEHVDGGTGFFGSLAQVEYTVFVARP